LQLNQEGYHRLISGQSGGSGAVLLRFFLGIAAKGYSTAVGLRNFSYSQGWLKTHRASTIVISIGNITAGGTGKTPLVIWLGKLLQQKGVRCAILTRGYKTRRASCVMRRAKNERDTQYAIHNTEIDEPAILAESCPEAKIVVNPDRVAGAVEAVSKFGAEVLVMDDGFQHRRLGRDLDIVAIDATRPFGYDKILPAGLLREPLASLKRATAVVITRCDQTTKAELTQIEERLQQVNPDIIIARSIHAPAYLKYPEPLVIPTKAGIQKNSEIMDSCLRRNDSPEQLKDKKIFAFCGIGNPDAFLNTIKQFGANLAGSKIYDDHHHYTDDCLADIYKQAKHLKVDLILTTN
jgi:tetraacyldisaccharide 4'-kinase